MKWRFFYLRDVPGRFRLRKFESAKVILFAEFMAVGCAGYALCCYSDRSALVCAELTATFVFRSEGNSAEKEFVPGAESGWRRVIREAIPRVFSSEHGFSRVALTPAFLISRQIL